MDRGIYSSIWHLLVSHEAPSFEELKSNITLTIFTFSAIFRGKNPTNYIHVCTEYLSLNRTQTGRGPAQQFSQTPARPRTTSHGELKGTIQGTPPLSVLLTVEGELAFCAFSLHADSDNLSRKDIAEENTLGKRIFDIALNRAA